jgi:hypothetical protein
LFEAAAALCRCPEIKRGTNVSNPGIIVLQAAKSIIAIDVDDWHEIFHTGTRDFSIFGRVLLLTA